MMNEYYPDFVSSPGETLQETLDFYKMSHEDLAAKMQCDVQCVRAIIQGRAIITSSIALQLEEALPSHIAAIYWITREQNYRNFLRSKGKENPMDDEQPITLEHATKIMDDAIARYRQHACTCEDCQEFSPCEEAIQLQYVRCGWERKVFMLRVAAGEE